MDLKIKISVDPVTGEQRVPPECMRLLLSFATHRDLCEDCVHAWNAKTGRYCATGTALLDELLQQPEVQAIP